MPYSFIEIESEKRWVIRAVFTFLVFFYFLIAELLWLVTNAYIFSRDLFSPSFTLVTPLDIVGAAAIALIAALVHWLVSTDRIVEKVTGILGAREIDPKDMYHDTFRHIVEEVSVATGGIALDAYVIPSSGLNACAVAFREKSGAIAVTEGLLAKLTRAQLEAVVAHEAAHIASGDSRTTTIACALFGLYAALLAGIARGLEKSAIGVRTGRSSGGPLYLVIIFAILSIAQGVAFLMNMFLSREKELRADANSVRLTRDPLALAGALHIISRSWRGVGQIPEALSPLFIMSTDLAKLDETEGVLSNLFSTHPPVKRRVSVLLDMAHADSSALDTADARKEKVPLEESVRPLETEEAPPFWFLYKENKWQGPFDLEALLADGLTAASWVSRSGAGPVRHASDDPLLLAGMKGDPKALENAGKRLCPHCAEALSEALYEGAPVNRCATCGGVIAPPEVIRRIMVRDNYELPETAKRLAEAAIESRSHGMPTARPVKTVFELACPQCGGTMARSFYSTAYPIEVDRCMGCGSVWFDTNELEALQYLYEKFDK